MMPETTVSKLTTEAFPGQFRLLADASALLASSPAVTDLSVRGSLAIGNPDRMSDIDFIIGVIDTEFAAFASVLDALMSAELGAIFPGWHDTIVRDLGGLGYVYLVTSGSNLYQIDAYVTPATQAAEARRRSRAQVIYARPHPDAEAGMGTAIRQFIDTQRSRTRSCSELLVEILVLAQMISKRIRRRQHFIRFAQTNLLLEAVKDLIKTALAPASVSWGWYHLEEEVGATPLGQRCLDDLSDLISSPPAIGTVDALLDTVHRVLRIARRAAPQSVEALGPALGSYLYYLESA
jgi:predicted nucleotidyltransferase